MVKPHRMKKLTKKAMRKASNTTSSSYENHSYYNSFSIKPFNKERAKEMLRSWKKDQEHMHLKIKPHHHKRTTPGSVDAENPLTVSGHSIDDKTMRTKTKRNTQKSLDLARKEQRNSHKKAS
ncbi:hypothetical protein K0U07_03825 [bacterium]|nr:hypothetical protein [bacterium]